MLKSGLTEGVHFLPPSTALGNEKLGTFSASQPTLILLCLLVVAKFLISGLHL